MHETSDFIENTLNYAALTPSGGTEVVENVQHSRDAAFPVWPTARRWLSDGSGTRSGTM
jgi:hypothetical protein